MKSLGYNTQIIDGGKKEQQKIDEITNIDNLGGNNFEKNDLENFQQWNNKNTVNIPTETPEIYRNTFLNGDNICEGCIDNSAVINCDVKKDNLSSYAIF